MNGSTTQGFLALLLVFVMFATGPALLARWAVKRRQFIHPDDRAREWTLLVVGVVLTLADALLVHELLTTTIN